MHLSPHPHLFPALVDRIWGFFLFNFNLFSDCSYLYWHGGLPRHFRLLPACLLVHTGTLAPSPSSSGSWYFGPTRFWVSPNVTNAFQGLLQMDTFASFPQFNSWVSSFKDNLVCEGSFFDRSDHSISPFRGGGRPHKHRHLMFALQLCFEVCPIVWHSTSIVLLFVGFGCDLQ